MSIIFVVFEHALCFSSGDTSNLTVICVCWLEQLPSTRAVQAMPEELAPAETRLSRACTAAIISYAVLAQVFVGIQLAQS